MVNKRFQIGHCNVIVLKVTRNYVKSPLNLSFRHYDYVNLDRMFDQKLNGYSTFFVIRFGKWLYSGTSKIQGKISLSGTKVNVLKRGRWTTYTAGSNPESSIQSKGFMRILMGDLGFERTVFSSATSQNHKIVFPEKKVWVRTYHLYL